MKNKYILAVELNVQFRMFALIVISYQIVHGQSYWS